MSNRLRVLALATYPFEAAASRYRIVQFIEPLARRGIDVTFAPFLDAPLFEGLYVPAKLMAHLPRLGWRVLRRIGDLARVASADVVWIQREAMLFGPPILEWVARTMKRPIVLDLDDATYISYDSPVYGRVGRLLKWPGKTDRLLSWSAAVLAGNETIASYAQAAGKEAHLARSIVDLRRFTPVAAHNPVPVIGWIGTHGTFPFVEPLLPVLRDLAREHSFRLRIVGAERERVDIAGVDADLQPWRLEKELSDFQSLDIGLYPLTENDWNAGKSGFKAVQYMAVGVPFVMSPVGVCATLGVAGTTHFLARTPDEWGRHLAALLAGEDLRRAMGRAGRRYAEEHFALEPQADRIAEILRRAASRGR